MTPAEIGVMMTDAFGEEKGREIVEAIVGMAIDDTMEAQREHYGKTVMRTLFQDAHTKAAIKKRWWHR